MIVLGFLALSAGNIVTPEKFREPICSSDKAKDLESTYLNAIDKVMCSDICPCANGAGNKN